MRYNLKLELSMFNQSIWATNLFPINATMQKNTWPNLINILIYMLALKYEYIY
jgi:hypothetical protein